MVTNNSINILVEKLDEFIRKYYKNQLVKGLLYGLGLVLAFYLLLTVIEYYAHFNTVLRTVLFYSFIGASAYIIGKFIALPLFKLNKLGSIISYEEAATIIGTHFTNVQDKLLNVLQLQKTESAINTQQSVLIEAAITQKIKELKPVPFTAAIDLKQNKKYVKYALIPSTIFFFLLFAAPSILTESTNRLVKHNTYFEKQAPFQFTILNKELKGIQQEDFDLNVKLNGNEVPSDVYINIDGNEFKLNKENTVTFNYQFKNLQKTSTFYFTADGFNSKEYELTVLPNPILLNFGIALEYPKYLNKPNERVSNTGDLVIPVGTKARWEFNTKNTEAIRLLFNDTTIVLAPKTENSFAYSMRLMTDKKYAVTTLNKFIKSKDSVSYGISVIPDNYPTIDVAEKKDSLSQKLYYFKGTLKDDYGFSSLTFNYRFINQADSNGKPNSNEAKLKTEILAISKQQNTDQFYHIWDLNQLTIQPGDQIEYYFEVKDNDGVHGAKAARTATMFFKAPTTQEIAENADKKNAEVKADLKETIQDAKDLQKQLNDLNRKILEKKELSYEEKKKMQDLLKKQNDLQQKVEEIKNENQKNTMEQSEFKPVDQQIAEKQKQLQDLLNEILTPEMKEKMKELEKLMSQLDKNKMQNELEKMKMDAKDIEKELDRTLEAFKRMEVEQKLQQNIEQLNELKKEQQELAKKTEDKKEDAKELEKKQEELNKKFEDFQKNMDDLQKKNKELEDPNKLNDTEKQEQAIEKEMQKSKEQLGNDKKDKAKDSQKNAADKMEQLSQEMQAMQQQMEQEQNEEDAKALREILDNLLQLSFDQEALMNNSQKTNTNNPQYPKIAQQQKKLKDDAKMIEDSLLALSKRVPEIKSTVNREISAINMSMEKAIAALAERQNYEAASRQQFSMTSINNLALILNESLQQMQQKQMESKQKSPGSGSCKKPGGKGQKPSMSNLRQMQQKLNEQMQKMKEALEKQGKKGKDGKQGKEGNKGGSEGSQGMSEELAKMAAQQEYIRQQMQKLGEQMGKDNPNGKPGGNTAKKMEETETDLVNKLITTETLKRQQEILTKLLDYEKAEKEREEDNKRESKDPKVDYTRNVKDFEEYKKLKERETELLKTIPPSLNPFYKGKVNEYFNNFGQ